MAAKDKVAWHDFSASADKQSVFWALYDKYRPQYPAAFWSRVFDYHSSHRGRWDSAHDFGAGQGLVAKELATRFSHVAVSDPNPAFLDVAREGLNKLDSDGLTKASLTFASHRGEDDWLAPQSQDFVGSNCAIHWMDPALAIAAAARSLKPGGTLFVATYIRPVVLDNDPAQEAWNDVWRQFGEKVSNPGASGQYARDRAQMVTESAMDIVGFPEELFESVVRIRINASHADSFKNLPRPAETPFPIMVGPRDLVERVDEPGYVPDAVNMDWFKAVMATMSTQSITDDFDWTAMEKAVGANGKVTVAWPVAVILATRK